MPALPPPSMVIGAPMPGLAPTAVTGTLPANLNATPAAATIVQQSGASTNVSGPTNIVHSFSNTKAGTLLVWAVAVNASAAAALGGTPTGWTLIQSQAVATLALGLYVQVANSGGFGQVTFSSVATATTGGIASWFWEINIAPFAVLQSGSANGSSTALAAGAITPTRSNLLAIGAGAWVLGAATAANNTSPAGWAVQAQQSSTNGTTNAAIEAGSYLDTANLGGSTAYNYALTLSGSSVWAAAELFVPSLLSSQVVKSADLATVVDQGAGYAAQVPGIAGWSVGGSKPGGNGGGQ